MRVDLWSDINCPWCYIGITRFNRAVERFGDDVTVALHPFQLDAEAPIPGIPAPARYASRFGDDASEMLERVRSEGASDGLTFDWDRALSANSFDAHRAIAFARGSGKDRALEMALFEAYFTDGLDISDRAVLVARGATVGLDGAALAAYLESDDGVDEVRGELMRALDLGITSVPSFVFGGQFIVPGAVDVETFVRILEQMRDVA